MPYRPSAPGPLGLVEAFLRTRNEITDAAGLGRWCAEHGLAGDASAGTYERAMRLREALRSLMLANNGGPAAPEALTLVNGEIGACGLRPEIAEDGLRWPARGLLGTVLGGVVAAMAAGTWPRMKACAADDCSYAFYDHTRNRSGRWCDVSGCGANARMRAYRQRRETSPGAP
ncbi:CGNR zinc finger domain-containing protein [Actinomadura sp. DC4]|uniref:CGNR zinc finger domain-containing protein n=1 Tax=Actinomadura sp. DC4 TaxID=3055069 RepID=UPI0025B20BB4|nr:CGNR zinc finger domain-containing protein [Actinomadura sp. DC4]MDN3358421.1 CGNR zinc finger domain-containing protein [Actinomadura sp. DC4]